MSSATPTLDRVSQEIVAASIVANSLSAEDMTRKLKDLILGTPPGYIGMILQELEPTGDTILRSQIVDWIPLGWLPTAESVAPVMKQAFVRAMIQRRCERILRAIETGARSASSSA